MCGICGEWCVDGASAERLRRMNETLSHRGPDDRGLQVVGRAGLAMRRLSIIDLEGGQQPIANEDESVLVVCNGEIYNYRELREELAERGHRFATGSDVEVIVHLYEEVGERLVDHLRGMFAFALWDRRTESLLLARDRFGQKPLFYHSGPGHFVFGSEIKAVLRGIDRTPALDLGAIDDYLTLRFVPSPSTMFETIRKLPPGHLLRLESRGGAGLAPSIRVDEYYRLRYSPKVKISEADAVGELASRLRETVRSHLVSDVPLGAYLSGGMDSSLIVALMSEHADRPIQTFSVGVPEQDFNELPFAQMVADRWRTEHRTETVQPDLVRLLPRMIYHLDEPSDPIAACMYHSAALAARHVKVVLGGDGGDEMFAGFDRYYGYRWVDLYAALPAVVRRRLLGPLLQRLPDSAGYKNLTQRLRWLQELSLFEHGRRYAQATVFFRFGDEDKKRLYSAATIRQLGQRDATRCIVRAFDDAVADDDLDRMLYCDLVTRMSEHSLMLTDRMTMAHGLEGRSPFLDHRLAEFVATLPSELKIKGRTLKYVMRKVAEPLLPRAILERPKMGFMFPLGYWIKGPLLPVLRALFADSRLVAADVLTGSAVDVLLEEHVAGLADHHVRLWMLLNLEIWYRMFVEGSDAGELENELSTLVGGRQAMAAAP